MMMCHFRSEMSELKPCPFCGGEAELCYSEVDTFCRKCNVIQETEMWNTRPIEDELRARIAELEAESDQLTARLCQERQDDKWIPVSERLPEANKCVLIYDAGGNMTVDILVKSGGVETYFWLPKYRILFWMPLPEPPVNQLTAHNDTERQDDKSPNNTQTQTIVYGKESEE